MWGALAVYALTTTPQYTGVVADETRGDCRWELLGMCIDWMTTPAATSFAVFDDGDGCSSHGAEALGIAGCHDAWNAAKGAVPALGDDFNVAAFDSADGCVFTGGRTGAARPGRFDITICKVSATADGEGAAGAGAVVSAGAAAGTTVGAVLGCVAALALVAVALVIRRHRAASVPIAALEWDLDGHSETNLSL